MKVTSILGFTLAAIASPAPNGGKDGGKGGSSTKCANPQLATFDDLVGVPALSQINPVGTYKGLKYTSFNVLVQGVAGIITTGIQPQSGVQVAANGITDSVLNGAPALTPASPYKAFSLSSLYFGCVINSLESAAGVPQQCTIAVTAYLPGSTVVYQTINQQFNPASPLLSKMAKATFSSSWQKMGKISIAVVQSTTTSTLTGLLIDNLQYTLCK